MTPEELNSLKTQLRQADEEIVRLCTEAYNNGFTFGRATATARTLEARPEDFEAQEVFVCDDCTSRRARQFGRCGYNDRCAICGDEKPVRLYPATVGVDG